MSFLLLVKQVQKRYNEDKKIQEVLLYMEQIKAITLTIDLVGSNPLITRTVRVPLICTFEQLHNIIQTVFGWMDYHLYEFVLPNHALSLVSKQHEDMSEMQGAMNFKYANEATLEEVITSEDMITYIYDFGDDWKHTIIVGEVVVQDEDYPVLLTWQEDNACENAGGISGYYEKCEIMKNHNHPEHEWIKEWMRMEHVEFDPEIVKEELRLIMEEFPFSLLDIENPLEFLMEALDQVYDFVIEDTLFMIDFSNERYYVWFHDGTETRNIRIFESKEDCALVCLDQNDTELINPLFMNGLILDYPDYVDEEEEEPSYSYRAFGKNMELEEVLDFTAKLCDLLCPFVQKVEEDLDLDFFPDYHEEQAAIHMEVDDNGIVEVNTIDFPMKLEMSKASISQAEQNAIKQIKGNGEHLYTTILPIANLLHDEIEEDFVYAWMMKGEHTEYFKIFERKDMEALAMFIKDELLAYIKSNGKPSHLYCDDERIRTILHELCKKIKLPLDFKQLESEALEKLYDQMMVLHNDPALYDSEFLSTIDDMIENAQDMEDHILQPLLRKAARYLSYDNYIMSMEELDATIPDDIDLL